MLSATCTLHIHMYIIPQIAVIMLKYTYKPKLNTLFYMKTYISVRNRTFSNETYIVV